MVLSPVVVRVFSISGMVDLVADGRGAPDRVVWWGHATVEIQLGLTTVLTDPILTSRVGHLVRRRGPCPPPDIRRPGLVLLSHLHADHTHLPSLKMLPDDTPIVVPAGAPDRLPALRRLGNPLIELTTGGTATVGDLRISAVPADHDGRRWRRGPRDVDAVGYTIEGSSLVYFAGDTALFDGMSTGVPHCDVALLPVGGWGPTRGAGHMDPHDAAVSASKVGAAWSVPIHYGTLWPIGANLVRPHLFHDPGTQFADECARLGLRARVLAPGESWHVPH